MLDKKVYLETLDVFIENKEQELRSINNELQKFPKKDFSDVSIGEIISHIILLKARSWEIEISLHEFKSLKKLYLELFKVKY